MENIATSKETGFAIDMMVYEKWEVVIFDNGMHFSAFIPTDDAWIDVPINEMLGFLLICLDYYHMQF